MSRFRGPRRVEPTGQEQPKLLQAVQPRPWPDLLVTDARRALRDSFDGRRLSADKAENARADAEESIVTGILDLIAYAAGHDWTVDGLPSPQRIAENVAVRTQILASRLLNTLDGRYEPQAERPDHDWTMPHKYVPDEPPECPPNCPAQLPAPTLAGLQAALVAVGIPLERVEAPEAPEHLTQWQRLAADTGVDLGDAQAYSRIAAAVSQMAWNNAQWAAAGGRIQAALRAPTANPGALADRVEILVASEAQHLEASSHREQLRQHYWQALRSAYDEYLDLLTDEAMLAAKAFHGVDLAELRDRIGTALDNPPEWDRKVRP